MPKRTRTTSVSYTHLVCNNAPCYISKSHVMAKFLRKELGINFGETTPDGMFSLQYMPCVGACNIGPVIKIGDRVYGNLNDCLLYTSRCV